MPRLHSYPDRSLKLSGKTHQGRKPFPDSQSIRSTVQYRYPDFQPYQDRAEQQNRPSTKAAHSHSEVRAMYRRNRLRWPGHVDLRGGTATEKVEQ